MGRMVPICYEEALPNGCAPSCAEFMAAATEQFMKEAVGAILSRTRSNILSGAVGGSTIMTKKYRQQLNRETLAFEEGKLHKGPLTNMLPVEAKEALGRRTLGIGDFRLAMQMNSCALGQMPDILQNISGGYHEGVLEGWGGAFENDLSTGPELSKTRVNGNLPNGNQTNGAISDSIDNGPWLGSGQDDRNQLFSALDECLATGRS